METQRANIVQVEFFHVGGKDTSLSEFSAECDERMADIMEDIFSGVKVSRAQSSLKTCVRFYDVDGSISKFVKHAQDIDTRYNDTIMALSPEKGWRQVWQHIKFQWVAHQKHQIKKQKAALAFKGFARTVKTKSPISVEDWEHRYIPMPADEVHELLEAARGARDVWMFLFAHNELFADQNELIASAM